jgi:DNA-binding response OmpR family regulator
MARILIVEDERDLALGLKTNLEIEGYDVEVAHTGEAAVAAAIARRPDVVLLDVMLPGIDGFEVLRRLRNAEVHGPVLMLTARAEEVDKVRGFRAGADDYVTKPFGLAELRSRIRAVLRRAQGRVVEGSLHVGPVGLDRDLRRVTVEGDAVKLTFSEFELLGCLMSRPGYAFNRQELLRAIWGDSAYRDPRAIDVHIRHLREKLEERPEEPSLILTVPGTGYRFREP